MPSVRGRPALCLFKSVLYPNLALACLIIALPSFFMGMPFPIGLKIVDSIKKSDVPWAWGINGCVSVISTSLAVITAVELGFIAMMLIAALSYALAFLSNFLLIQKSE